MAVPAVDPVVLDVMQVAELHRLLDEFVRAGDVVTSGPAPSPSRIRLPTAIKNAGKTELREGVGAATENLRHRMLQSGRTLETTLLLSTRHDGRDRDGLDPRASPSCTTL